MWNLIRWVSPRTIKETFVPPTDYRYPFLAPDARATARASRARDAGCVELALRRRPARTISSDAGAAAARPRLRPRRPVEHRRARLPARPWRRRPIRACSLWRDAVAAASDPLGPPSARRRDRAGNDLRPPARRNGGPSWRDRARACARTDDADRGRGSPTGRSTGRASSRSRSRSGRPAGSSSCRARRAQSVDRAAGWTDGFLRDLPHVSRRLRREVPLILARSAPESGARTPDEHPRAQARCRASSTRAPRAQLDRPAHCADRCRVLAPLDAAATAQARDATKPACALTGRLPFSPALTHAV